MYNFLEIEAKWQKKWAEDNPYKASKSNPNNTSNSNNLKCYVLEMLPYPSGRVHIGHARNYTIGDVYARYKHACGYQVLHPMGWDAFGLPAENASIKNNVHPMLWTMNNIADMKQDLQRLGFSYDWDCELNTCQPDYYGLTQKLFLQLYEKGLAYKADAMVNWDPVENTVLANEQVVDGKGWRSGALVEKKMLPHWFLKITDYAEDLIAGLDNINWPEHVKTMQLNWIGKSVGANISFDVVRLCDLTSNTTDYSNIYSDSVYSDSLDSDPQVHLVASMSNPNQNHTHQNHANYNHTHQKTQNLKPNIAYEKLTTLEIFTTQPHTLFGAAFCGLSFKHALIDLVMQFFTPEQKSELDRYIAKQKANVALHDFQPEYDYFDTKLFAVHPFTGKLLPIYLVDYVLPDYGSGAVFGCPAHDERDMELANRINTHRVNNMDYERDMEFNDMELANRINTHRVNTVAEDVQDKLGKYKLSIIQVIKEVEDSGSSASVKTNTINTHMINSDFLNMLTPEEAKQKMIEVLSEKKIGNAKVCYRLRDWGISRQRYWGCPIPMINCAKCGVVPVPASDLPVLLPDTSAAYEKYSVQGNLLDTHPTWKHVKCPKCSSDACRETETMDTFVDSSWYFLRYAQLCQEQANCLQEGLQPETMKQKDLQPFTNEALKNWMPVDIYIGGIEHAILHLLYARFFMKALTNDTDVNSHATLNKTCVEPFKQLFTQGMVLNHTYKNKDGEYIYPEEVFYKDGKAVDKDGDEVTVDSAVKMSKSLKNDVNLKNLLQNYGADAVRLAVLSDSPPNQELIWTEANLIGCWRFINKIYALSDLMHKTKNTRDTSTADDNLTTLSPKPQIQKMHIQFNRLLDGLTQDLEQFKFNTYIAKLRMFVNLLEEKIKDDYEVGKWWHVLIKICEPIMPHLAQELYSLEMHNRINTDQGEYCYHQAWPTVDQGLLEENTKQYVVQCNGKKVLEIELDIEQMSMNIPDDEKIKIVWEQVSAKKMLTDKYKKVIIVNERGLINFVL